MNFIWFITALPVLTLAVVAVWYMRYPDEVTEALPAPVGDPEIAAACKPRPLPTTVIPVADLTQELNTVNPTSLRASLGELVQSARPGRHRVDSGLTIFSKDWLWLMFIVRTVNN